MNERRTDCIDIDHHRNLVHKYIDQQSDDEFLDNDIDHHLNGNLRKKKRKEEMSSNERFSVEEMKITLKIIDKSKMMSRHSTISQSDC